MNLIQEKFNGIWLSLLRLVSTQIGLRVTDTEPNKLILAGDLSNPGRGTGLWFVFLMLLPLHSDFLEDPNSTSIFNGYEFFSDPESIALRLCVALPALWVYFIYGKYVRCLFDKSTGKFLIAQKTTWFPQKVEGNLQDITAVEMFEVELPNWILFGKDEYGHIQVNLTQRSGKPVLFVFMYPKNKINDGIDFYRHMLLNFLDLPT